MLVEKIRVLATAVCMALLSPCSLAGAQTVTLGVLTDLNGPYADQAGKGAVEATRMAAEDLREALGTTKVQVLSADHQGLADVGSAIARQWLDVQGVDAIVNVPSSAVALAVQSLTRERKKIFLITGASTPDLTGKACSEYSADWTDDTYSLSAGARAIVAAGGAETWFLITVDYAGGYGLADATRRVVEAGGGRIVGEVRHPFNTTDFSSYLLQAQSSGAKVIALANAGNDTVNAIRQAHEFAIATHGQQLVATVMFITDVHSLGVEIAQGLYFTTGFYWDRTEGSRAFSKRFFARIGRMPTREQAETYSAVTHYLRGVIAVGSTDSTKVMQWMKATPVDDFYAPGGRLRQDGRLMHPVYLYQIKTPAESKYPWDYYKFVSEIPAEQAFRSLADGGCSFIKP